MLKRHRGCEASGCVPALSLVSGEGGWQRQTAGCSGSEPGHTLCLTASEKPWSDGDWGLEGEVRRRQEQKYSSPLKGTSAGTRGSIVLPAQPLDTSGL